MGHSSGNSPASNMVSTKLIVLALVVVVVALADAAPRFFIIDDGLPDESALRVRRDTDIAATNVHGGAYHRGKVGPVYSFVKTDPKANFKWGVRHRAGAQYGRYGARGLHGRRELSVTTSATRWRNLTLLCIIHSPHG